MCTQTILGQSKWLSIITKLTTLSLDTIRTLLVVSTVAGGISCYQWNIYIMVSGLDNNNVKIKKSTRTGRIIPAMSTVECHLSETRHL